MKLKLKKKIEVVKVRVKEVDVEDVVAPWNVIVDNDVDNLVALFSVLLEVVGATAHKDAVETAISVYTLVQK